MGPSRERPFFFQAGRTTKPAHGLSATGEVKPNFLPAGSPEHSSASVCSGSSCSGSGLQFGLGIGLGSGLGSGSGSGLGSGFGLGLVLGLGPGPGPGLGPGRGGARARASLSSLLAMSLIARKGVPKVCATW